MTRRIVPLLVLVGAVGIGGSHIAGRDNGGLQAAVPTSRPALQAIVPFQDRMLPALKGKGFRQEGYWVWCGSVIEGEDGRYHMFASRWPKKYPFFHGYRAASEVVRASADQPAGPYRFEEVVLPARDPKYWDGRMTHNPVIVKYGKEYLLFYIGDTFK